MPTNASQRVIYESVKMLHKDGTLMCRTTRRRAEWFIVRKLAAWVEEGKVFQLNFVSGGHGKSTNPYYTQPRENICVVCGKDHDLNRHHVFPRVFRKNMSTLHKSSNSHDVLSICTDCHESYETEAEKFKKQILREYAISDSEGSLNEDERYNVIIMKARGFMEFLNGGTSFEKNGKLITPPIDVIERFKRVAAQELRDTVDVSRHWGKQVMDIVVNAGEEEAFIQRWRKHFVDTMNPQFLPKYWSVDAPIEVIDRVRKNTVLNEYDYKIMESQNRDIRYEETLNLSQLPD